MKSTVLHAPRILRAVVVDDSWLIRRRVRNLLKAHQRHLQLIEADTAIDGWLVCKCFQPDLVVLDFQLPDFSGEEVLRRIKDSTPWCAVVILSNYADPAIQQHCLELGAESVLHKSRELHKLSRLIPPTRSRKAPSA